MIEILILDALETAAGTLREEGVRSREDLTRLAGPVVRLSANTREADGALARFLHSRMYRHPIVARMNLKARRIMKDLFNALIDQPEALSQPFRDRVEVAGEPVAPVVCDFLATLTYRSALEPHADLFDPCKPAGADPALPDRF